MNNFWQRFNFNEAQFEGLFVGRTSAAKAAEQTSAVASCSRSLI